MGTVRKATSLTFFMALSGLAVLLISLIPVTSIDEVINTSFKVGPGTKYGWLIRCSSLIHKRLSGWKPKNQTFFFFRLPEKDKTATTENTLRRVYSLGKSIVYIFQCSLIFYVTA
jgi:hypothetical protein